MKCTLTNRNQKKLVTKTLNIHTLARLSKPYWHDLNLKVCFEIKFINTNILTNRVTKPINISKL
jgi:hypothetical protein